MKRILIVEDDALLGRGLRFDLEADGYTVALAPSAAAARSAAGEAAFDLILLDVNLPDGDGFSLYPGLSAGGKVPVIFLTARDLEEDQLRGFDLGADDYITKPFNMALLRKRVAAVLRRGTPAAEDRFDDGWLRVSFESYEATQAGRPLNLTPAEYKLLRYMVQNPRRVLTRQMLLDRLWDADGQFVDEHALTVSVGRLRAKIEDKNHRYIKTIYGTGYQWMGEQNG